MLEDVLAVVQSLAVTAAAIVAVVGISAWRKEYLGKRRIELAEQLLIGFYEARDAIALIRSPFGRESEGKTRRADPQESPEEARALDNAYVLIERYQTHTELWSRLQALRYQSMARFGTVAEQPFQILQTILSELRVAASSLGRIWSDPSAQLLDSERRKEFGVRRERWEAVFWEGPSSEDPIAPRVDEMITVIEEVCKPIVFAGVAKTRLTHH